jgi:hypothetical protein
MYIKLKISTNLNKIFMEIFKIPACWPSTFVFGISVAGKGGNILKKFS